MLIISIFLLACSHKNEKKQINKEAETSIDNNLVILSSEQISTLKIRYGHIEKRNLNNVIKANGYLDVPPQNKAVISPMITGYVRKINFLVGSNVKKGQIMAELESLEYIDLQQQFVELNARIKYLKEEFDRQQILLDGGGASKKNYLLAEVNYKTAISSLTGLKSKLDLLGADFDALNKGAINFKILMKAPISGSVIKMNIVIGKHVDPSEEIFEIVNPEHLHIELNVYEKDVVKIKEGQKVWYKVPSLKNQIFEGEVFLVGKDLSENKRSINVHVHIDEEDGQFTVGMYVNASIVIEDNPTFTLPITAVELDGNIKYVFKKEENDGDGAKFIKYPVITNAEFDGLVEVTSFGDLTVDDDIVVEGAFYLLNAFTSKN